MTKRTPWSEEEITLALALYCVTPYSRITPHTPGIARLGELLERTSGAASMKLANLAFLDPAVAASGRKGFANGSRTDKVVWERYTKSGDLTQLVEDAQKFAAKRGFSLDEILGDASTMSLSPVAFAHTETPTLLPGETEAMAQMRIRRGQDFFRRTVLAKTGGACAITHCPITQLIEAAHILPWSDYPEHRLDVRNGIMLSSTFHRAFDANLFGITPDGIIVISDNWLSNCGDERQRRYLDQVNHTNVDFGDRFQVDRSFLATRFDEFVEQHGSSHKA